MARILNSLIIGEGLEAQRALEDIMGTNLQGYALTFTTLPLSAIARADREPDIIFIADSAALEPDGVAAIRTRFSRRIYVALTEAAEEERRAYLSRKLDEVMSVAELRSPVGRRLVEKLIAIRDLAAAEALLDQSEERFRGIIEHSHDALMLLDETETVVYTSPASGRMLGYEPWEILGQDFSAMVHEDDRESVREKLRTLAKGAPDSSANLEYRIHLGKGGWLHFESRATNLLANESVRAVVLNSRDVTRQRRIEAELEKYHRHLEDLAERRGREAEEANLRAEAAISSSPAALIATDGQGLITFVSRNYRDAHPLSSGMLEPGRSMEEAWRAVAMETGVGTATPDGRRVAAWLKAPEGPEGYVEFREPSGAWLRMHARAIPGRGGAVIAVTDVTEDRRKQALLAEQSEELAAALAKEKEAAEQQRTFISMVSHEFRTPLAIIDGNAQIIGKRGEKLEEGVLDRRAGTIRAAVGRLVGLIETVLSADALESGRFAVSLAPCDLAAVLRETVAERQDLSPGHRIFVDAEGLPPEALLDAQMMRQMMGNLLSNAVKYSPAGSQIRVDVRAREGGAEIRVSDPGVGIPGDEMPRIFQKYFRASTAAGVPGSGLGLNLVRQLVELHNGSIALESDLGKGTVVIVRLPLPVC